MTMRVSAKLSEIDELTCQLCKEPSLQPVYHCPFNHLICVVCYNDYFSTVGPVCQFCEDESITVKECVTLSGLISKMQFQCPNVEVGCPVHVTLEDHDDHFRSCDHSKLSCPVCEVSFDDRRLLLDHFIDHSPRQFTYGVIRDATLPPGRYLFRESNTGVYYFLFFQATTLSVQHMVWENQKPYDLSVNYATTSYFTGSSGLTEEVQRWPRSSMLSLQIPEALANQPTVVSLMISGEEVDD